MKSIINLLLIIFITFSTIDDSANKIPVGKYRLQWDEKYIDSNNHGIFTLENDRFIMSFPDRVENLKVEWIDADSFIVKNYTESANPSAFEYDQIKRYRASFNILREENNEYYFIIGDQKKRDTLFSGKFVKIN